MAPEGEPEVFVHESATVEPGARLGRGCFVWRHAHIRAGVTAGEDCTFGNNAFVDEGVILGNGCKIQNNVCLYSGLRIGDDVFVGPGAIFSNDRNPRAGRFRTVRLTMVGDGASIGSNATIISGVQIGAWSMVGAGAVVTHPVAAHEVVVGNPARRLGWACRCGHVLKVDAPTADGLVCDQCGRTLGSGRE